MRNYFCLVWLAALVGCPQPQPGPGDSGSDAPGSDGTMDATRDAMSDAAWAPPDAQRGDAAPGDASPADGPPIDAAQPDATPVWTCNSCHLAEAEPGSGPHQAHLRDGSFFRPGRCDDCHVVPTSIDAPGHIDPPPAEVVFGDLAAADDVAPTWDGELCTVYCHGPSRSGSALPDLAWEPPPEVACGACHGVPPPVPHPQGVPSCASCHPFAGFVPEDPSRHADGILDLTLSCTSCHGTPPSQPAPPRDTHGATSTAARGVGAHASHLGPSDFRAAIACEDCHVVPTSFGTPTHLDGDGIAEVTFGTRATARGAEPTWDGNSCSGVYCHGGTIAGGAWTTPVWTVVDGAQAACGTCHSLPPGGLHPEAPNCASCHPAVVDADRNIIAPDLHVNGEVEADGGCPICHATPRDNGDGLPSGGRRAIIGEFPESHGHFGAVLDDNACRVCHDVSAHRSGTVVLKDPDGGPTFAFGRWTDLTSDPDVSDFCLACHDTDGATALAAPDDPFGNGAPPDVAARFAGTLTWTEWYGGECFPAEGTLRHVNSHHDISSTDQLASGAKLECLNCHGAHAAGRTQPLADPLAATTPWAEGENGFCLRCHAGGTGPLDPELPPGVVGPSIPLRGIDSCAYGDGPFWVHYSWTHSAHGPDSKRAWPGYSGAPGAELGCTTCHDPHGSATPTHPQGNPYAIRDWVDGSALVDDGTKNGGFLGPPWTSFGESREVVVTVSGTDVGWGSPTGLCNACHSRWSEAYQWHASCSGCQTCHGHGQDFGEQDLGGNGSDTPCP